MSYTKISYSRLKKILRNYNNGLIKDANEMIDRITNLKKMNIIDIRLDRYWREEIHSTMREYINV